MPPRQQKGIQQAAGGKSFANNLLVYYAVLYGARALIVDPKAERGNWKRLPTPLRRAAPLWLSHTGLRRLRAPTE